MDGVLARTALLLFALLFTTVGHSAPIPGGGSYKAACKGCYLDRESEELVCQCPDEEGKMYEQRLDVSVCLEGKVQYKDGYLFCNNSEEDEVPETDQNYNPDVDPDANLAPTPEIPPEEATEQSPEEPSNSSPESEPQFEPAPQPEPEQEPQAEEQAPEEPEVIAPIPAPPTISKKPVPVAEENNYELPPGNYKKFCPYCRMEGNLLVCDCKLKSSAKRSKDFVKTSINPKRCTKREVTYAKGSLVCQTHLTQVLDHFQCRKCKVSKNSLECECLRTPCQWSKEDIKAGKRWRKTRLADARFCTKDINNCNGKLRCGKCGTLDYVEEFRRPYKGKQYYETCPH